MNDDERSIYERWAVLRFSVVAPLLSAPPPPGLLQNALRELSEEKYDHPSTGEKVSFGVSTIERWYYKSRHEREPVRALRQKVRGDKGRHHVPEAQQNYLREQYEAHATWNYKLHHDNLVAAARADKALGVVRSYATVRRFMQRAGLVKQRRRGKEGSRTEKRHASHEKRSYEVAHVHGLGHLDFHECSRALVKPSGQLEKPQCFCALDDHSRLACHVQWYWHEDTESLCHGISQAIMKRGLMRRMMTDGGAAMKSEEFRGGLAALGVLHEMTLDHSPEQNGKQEHFWTPLEDRLMAMLEGVPDLTLEMLNEATQAWVEMEYNRRVHSETGETPLERFMNAPNVGRPSPTPEELQRGFRVQRTRTQRRSDGTITVDNVRFELPSRFRTLPEVRVRYARWDLRTMTLFDPDVGVDLCPLFPLDREKNADGRRAALRPVEEGGPPPPSGVAPLLKALIAEYAATGLPPAYSPLPAREDMTRETDNQDDPSTEEMNS